MPDTELGFWEHLDELRSVLIKSVAAWLGFSVLAFFLKEPLFRVLFSPLGPGQKLINIDVTAPFLIHMQVALSVGFIAALPFIIAWLYAFVAPALSPSGGHRPVCFVLAAFLLFVAGVALNWFLVFPLSFRFLSTYTLGETVVNQITVRSYISMLLVLSVMMGLLFEIPVVTWLLSRTGILRREHLKRYRGHVFIAILVLAALITPTGDPFTLLLVTLPVYLLYELSILIIPSKS
jgi:sec-independent protein translocase protein TatC